MIIQYIETALAHARYDMIDDEEPFYGEVPELPGVWATGKTLEECRRNLMEVIDGWIIVRLRRGLPIPPIDNCTIEDFPSGRSARLPESTISSSFHHANDA